MESIDSPTVSSMSPIRLPEKPASIRILLLPVRSRAQLPLLLEPKILKSDDISVDT